MTIDEAIDVFIDVSVCAKHRDECLKDCEKCCVYVPSKKIVEACDVALDALYICKTTDRYRIQVEKVS